MRLGPRSVRARLTLWHAGVLVLIVAAFSSAVYALVRERLRTELDARLTRDVATVERTYREAPWDIEEAETRSGLALFELTEAGKLVHRTKGWARLGLDTSTLGETALETWTAPGGDAFRVVVRSGPELRIAVAADETEVGRSLATLALILALGLPGAGLVALVAGYFLAGRVLAPVGAMAARARRITADSLDERLPVDDPGDEFGRLASTFNGVLARLQDAFERLRRFTADASHELRTPLTALRSVGEVALQRPLEPHGYREVVSSMLEEVEHLTRLVESLLVLTRGDSGRLRSAPERVDLGELAAATADHLRVLAEERSQVLSVQADGGVQALCDPALVRQALVNLVDNAIKYTPTGGEVLISARRLPSGEPAVEVVDTGPGIAAADRERIFERFYRVDAGRARAAGGVGLGLAIARAAVVATAGRIELESEPGRGSTFRVVLPVMPA